ncbi:carboxylesterase family protein [Alkalilimnicola ehrlichii]|uniref:carboxylesterase family protein n=1 Tax=Alkalilimnicola ehrlichii TaxID=351052 RepID=UPI0015F27A90|nr:carboxylesterase family protein [Alkalilimnicola ehrlichii]
MVIDPATGELLEIKDADGNVIPSDEVTPDDIIASAGFDETDNIVIDRMLTIWTNFAKTGNPSIPGELDYPLYESGPQMYVELSADAEVKDGRLADEFPEE